MSKSSEVKKRSSKNSGGCYGVMHSRKKKQNVHYTLYLSRDLMSKMWDEDRENVVESRYGQLSSTEKIEKKQNKTNQGQCKTN